MILGATPIILAAIGGHLPLVQVLMLMRFLIISKLSVTNLGSHLPRISASDQPWGRVEPPGPSDRMDLFDAGAQYHCSEFSHIRLVHLTSITIELPFS